METVSKEEMFQRRIQLAEIKENAWKCRGARTNHEEHSDWLEKERKEEEKGNVRERIRKLEKIKETEENDKRKDFLENWKEREGRKKKQRIAQEGWKRLMESVEKWEELVEETGNVEEDDIVVREQEEWTLEGFQEVGKLLDAVLDEVTAFIELRDMVSGTVLTNNSKHQHLSSQGATQPCQDVEISSQETRNTVSQEIVHQGNVRGYWAEQLQQLRQTEAQNWKWLNRK